jgi:signal transduction histidine kinase/DNA-binding response OmpR family regulator/CHASE3 domain sensor protein
VDPTSTEQLHLDGAPDPEVRVRGVPSLPFTTVAGFVAAVVALILISVLSYRSVQEWNRATVRTSHTIAVLDAADGVLAALTDAETSQRGYLLTGEERYLQLYWSTGARLDQALASLRQQTVADPERRSQVEAIDRAAGEKTAELRQTVELRRAGKISEAMQIVLTDRGKSVMDRLRAMLGAVRTDEERILDERGRESQRAATSATTVILSGAVALLFLFWGASFLTARDFRARAREAWIRAGQNALGTALQGDRRLDTLGDRLLAVLARYVDAKVGAIFLAEEDGTFRRFAGYGLRSLPGEEVPEVRPRDGLAGQAVKENRVIEVQDLPDGYLRVASSLGQAQPRHLLIVPATADDVVQAVIELGFLREPVEADRQLLSRGSQVIAAAVRSARDRTRLEELLDETQRQAEELQAQQQELQSANEELEHQGDALRDTQVRLESQQSELEQTNAQLEEQSQRLEGQRDDLLVIEQRLRDKAAELERVNRYKSEFLANMSHELRTPLNSSLIMAKLMAENRNDNLTAEQVRFAETIVSSGNDLLTLINDVLDLAKIDAGKIDIVAETVDLSRLLDWAKSMFDPLAQEKRVELEARLAEGAPATVATDPQRLRQILKNLLANAFKFTETGRVTLSIAAADNGAVRFEVRDTGIGIAPSQHEAIFEAFRQADGTTHRRYGGTGLGLSISRELARLLGGDIAVESAVGAGSTFTVTLPRSYVAPAAPAPEAAPARSTNGAPPRSVPVAEPAPHARAGNGIPAPHSNGEAAAAPAIDDRTRLAPGTRAILVIEDDLSFARLVADLARELGFLALIASSADEGVTMARTFRPSAIVLDMILPDHSGLSVLDRLKRSAETRHIPVHVVSASEESRAALTMGAVGYLLKPVQREQLAEAIRSLEGRFQQRTRRVLIVEDDAIERDAVAHLLAGGEVETVAVATVAEALRCLNESAFDCMVMDLSLADGTGFELLEQMMEHNAGSVPPVIVHTARTLSADEEQRLRRHSRSIIIKGARSPERLLDEVTLFLHQVEARLPPDRQRMLKLARDREQTFDRRRILVVEDDVRNVFALTSILEPRGARVDIARNGREALDRLGAIEATGDKVDLVLMDIMMPEMDGLTAMREIRKRPVWSQLPIIALTAKAMKDDQETCLGAGANDYLAKPLDLEKLLSLARIWMAK